MTDQDLKIVEAMERYGGGFVGALGHAAAHADAVNLRRLKAAFPDYWLEYEEIAELHAKRQHPTA